MEWNKAYFDTIKKYQLLNPVMVGIDEEIEKPESGVMTASGMHAATMHKIYVIDGGDHVGNEIRRMLVRNRAYGSFVVEIFVPAVVFDEYLQLVFARKRISFEDKECKSWKRDMPSKQKCVVAGTSSLLCNC